MDEDEETGVPLEHQTKRDIRQWAICEAGRYMREPDEILTAAQRYVDFVEGTVS